MQSEVQLRKEINAFVKAALNNRNAGQSHADLPLSSQDQANFKID